MQYMDLMKDPMLHPLWKRGFGNELVCLFQGIHDIQGRAQTLVSLLNWQTFLMTITSHMKKIVVIINLIRREMNRPDLQ
jgi:hypothetical protein